MRLKNLQKAKLVFFKNIAFIIIGTLTLSFGSAVFTIPFKLVSGGVTGLAIVIDSLFENDVINIELIVTVLTWLMFFIGLLVLGKDFAFKTLISSLIYPIGIAIFSSLTQPTVLGGFFNLNSVSDSQLSILLASLFGGVFIGAGCAITFLGGGSTGGLDIIAFSICKAFKKLRSSYVIFTLDAFIIILGMFTIKNITSALLGILSAFITAIVIDKLFLGESGAFIAQIVSDKSELLNQEIIKNLKRTTTFFDITGGYSKSGKKLIMVSFPIEQYTELIRLITKIDAGAFVIVHRAHEIRGEGWN